MVFLCLQKVGRLDFGGEIQLKSHGFSRAPFSWDGFIFAMKGGERNG
jgi:hypothetical protein